MTKAVTSLKSLKTPTSASKRAREASGRSSEEPTVTMLSNKKRKSLQLISNISGFAYSTLRKNKIKYLTTSRKGSIKSIANFSLMALIMQSMSFSQIINTSSTRNRNKSRVV